MKMFLVLSIILMVLFLIITEDDFGKKISQRKVKKIVRINLTFLVYFNFLLAVILIQQQIFSLKESVVGLILVIPLSYCLLLRKQYDFNEDYYKNLHGKRDLFTFTMDALCG